MLLVYSRRSIRGLITYLFSSQNVHIARVCDSEIAHRDYIILSNLSFKHRQIVYCPWYQSILLQRRYIPVCDFKIAHRNYKALSLFCVDIRQIVSLQSFGSNICDGLPIFHTAHPYQYPLALFSHVSYPNGSFVSKRQKVPVCDFKIAHRGSISLFSKSLLDLSFGISL